MTTGNDERTAMANMTYMAIAIMEEANSMGPDVDRYEAIEELARIYIETEEMTPATARDLWKALRQIA
jgi:hypothetical protein